MEKKEITDVLKDSEKKELRGSGSKENVGRPKITYEKKTLYKKNVPLEIYDLCKLLVDLEVLNWRLKNTNQRTGS